MRRSVHKNLELDLSLRNSRSIWLSLAIFCLPVALVGLARFIVGVDGLIVYASDTGAGLVAAITDIVVGIVLVALDVLLFERVREASRRLKRLHENPTADVHPLPAPFQASLFGPYH